MFKKKRDPHYMEKQVHKLHLRFLSEVHDMWQAAGGDDCEYALHDVTFATICAMSSNVVQAMVQSRLQDRGTSGVPMQVLEVSKQAMDVHIEAAGPARVMAQAAQMLKEVLPCMTDPEAMAGLGEMLLADADDDMPDDMRRMLESTIEEHKSKTPEALGEMVRKLDEKAEQAFDPANDFRSRLGVPDSKN
jgi:hypothetical protein